jgi:hypothetical protein
MDPETRWAIRYYLTRPAPLYVLRKEKEVIEIAKEIKKKDVKETMEQS